MPIIGSGAALTAPADTARTTFLRAQDFSAGQGAPTLGLVLSRWHGWTLRDAVSDRVNATFPTPVSTPVDIEVFWTNLSANAGGVAFQCHIGSQTVSDGPSNVTLLGGGVTTALAQNIGELKRTRIGSGVAFGTDMTSLIMVTRAASDAADTLAGDIAIIGVQITPTPAYPGVLVSDGAWCWFNEPRLVAHQPHGKLYSSYMTSDGGAGIASLDVASGAKASFNLHPQLEQDDHNNAGIAVRPDGKLLALYSRHSVVDDPIYYRVSTNVGDVTAWGAEQTITLASGDQPCYPKPAYDGARLYCFFRNLVSQDYVYSDDNGATWSAPQRLFSYSPGWRGYVNMLAKNDRIDFTTNDDNPNTSAPNPLYHCYLTGGSLYKTDGTLIGSLASLASTGATTAQLTKIYNNTVDGDAWGWDLQRDATGKPVVVFATFPTTTDHHYHYARWDGTAWQRTQFATGGKAFIDRGGELLYSGGLALLASDTSVVYLSRQVGATWEIERWITPDQGMTWVATPVTSGSREKNIRPTTPEGHYAGCPEVAWMAGWYVTFRHYGTRLVYRP